MAHGGMLAAARRLYPGAPEPFLDLSTGINPIPYPLPDFPAEAFTRLPDPDSVRGLQDIAARAYGIADPALVVAAPGTQILISLLPHLLRPGPVAILSPTYGEHAAAWTGAGHQVIQAGGLDACAGAHRVVLCNPNNPDGRRFEAWSLRALADQLGAKGGLLVVDEAFVDFEDTAISLAPHLPHPAIVVLRSFGKSFGLAGLRLGFALAANSFAAEIRGALGPWAISGAAILAGAQALADTGWRQTAAARLAADATRIDAMLEAIGSRLVGGTNLFRLHEIARAGDLRARLGHRGILVRGFQGHPNWLRFGLPGTQADWDRLRHGLSAPVHAP